jgi:hypothetical protein
MARTKMDPVTARECAEFFHVTQNTIQLWVLKQGCPRLLDKTFDLYAVHKWLLEQASKNAERGDLKEKKLEQEIEKLKITNSKLSEKFIDREEAAAVLTGRAVSLRNYLERAYQLTRADRSMRSVEELAAIDHQYIVEMMDAYCGGDADEK